MKKLLMILLALVLVTGLVAVTAAADPAAPGYKLYTLDLTGIDIFRDGIADQYNSNKQELNGAWMYCESDQFRYVFVELADGWEFDFDYPDEDTIGGDTTADFSPICWIDQNNALLLGNRVMALTLYGINDLQGGGVIHYCPRVINSANPEETAILDIHLNVEYQLTFAHRYWNDYNPADLWLSPGQSEVIKIFKGRDDVSGSVKVVDEDLNEANGNANFPTLEKITSGEDGNGSEEEANEGWYRLTAEHCFSGYIMWTDSGSGETRLLPLVCALPEVGFYTDSEATEGNYIRNGKYNHTDNAKPIYLILNSGDEGATMRLDDCRQGDWISWNKKVEGKVWEIDLDGTKFRDYDNIFANVTILYSNGREDGRRENINVLSALPGLRFCWPEWDENGPQPRLQMDRASQETSIPKGDGRALQLAWLEYDTETGKPVFTALTDDEIAQITISENGNNKISLQTGEENGTLITSIEVTDWTDGPVTFTHNGSSVYLYTELPEWGFYSTPNPSKATYLSSWVYDGTEDTAEIFFVYSGNWTNVNIHDWHLNFWGDVKLRVDRVDSRADCLRLRVRHSEGFQSNFEIEVWGDSDRGGFNHRRNLQVYDLTAALWLSDGDWDICDLDRGIPVDQLGKWYLETDRFWLNAGRDSEGDLQLPTQTVKNEKGEDLLSLERFDSGKYRLTALGYGSGFLEYKKSGVTYRMPISFQKQTILKVQEAYAKAGTEVSITITPQDSFDYSALALVVDYDEGYLTFDDAVNGAGYKEVSSDAEEQAAIEKGDNLFIYNTETKRLIWMPSAANGQTALTAQAGAPLATLTFTVKNEEDLRAAVDDGGQPRFVWTDEEGEHLNYGDHADIRLSYYCGRNDNEWNGEYSYLADENNDRNELCLGFDQGWIEILDHTPGDVNGDDEVTMMDVSDMLRWHVGYVPGPSFVESALDTDGDGQTNLWDVTWLLRWLSEWDNIILH